MTVQIIPGDCREVLATLPADSVHCVVTSPPYYGLRDYGVAGQIGLEPTPDQYIAELVEVFREVRRVLRKDGTVWLNLGDSYASDTKGSNSNGEGGSTLTSGARPHVRAAYNDGRGREGRRVNCGLPSKNLLMIPARVALALQADGWWLRSDIIWHKPNPMPESVTDRPTSAHEHVFLLAKSATYFFDADAVRETALWAEDARAGNGRFTYDGKRQGAAGEGQEAFVSINPAGRNIRNVWTIATSPYPEAHFATFPPELAERCIKAGCPAGGTVLDPFGGAGTTGLVADRLQRNAILIELNPGYVDLARNRVVNDAPLFAGAT